MPGLYKIGCTSRTPRERANELFTTGVPYPFFVEYYILVDDFQYLEKKIHSILHNFNIGKEWFKCDIYKCIHTIRNECYKFNVYNETIHRNDVSNYFYINDCRYKKDIDDKKRRDQEEEKKRIERKRQYELEEKIKSDEEYRKRALDKEKTKEKRIVIFWIAFIIIIIISANSSNPFLSFFLWAICLGPLWFALL